MNSKSVLIDLQLRLKNSFYIIALRKLKLFVNFKIRFNNKKMNIINWLMIRKWEINQKNI